MDFLLHTTIGQIALTAERFRVGFALGLIWALHPAGTRDFVTLLSLSTMPSSLRSIRFLLPRTSTLHPSQHPYLNLLNTLPHHRSPNQPPRPLGLKGRFLGLCLRCQRTLVRSWPIQGLRWVTRKQLHSGGTDHWCQGLRLSISPARRTLQHCWLFPSLAGDWLSRGV